MTLFPERIFSTLSEEELSIELKKRMKELQINYEDMSLQIGVSLSTFKRMINRPYQAKYSQVVDLVRELGGAICIEM